MLHKVILAPLSDLAAHQVFQVVKDWTLAGLTGPSIWIDVANPREAHVLSEAGAEKVPTSEWLGSGLKHDDELRLYSAQLLRDPKSALGFDEVQTALEKHPELAKSSGELVNVLIPVDDVAKIPSKAFFDYRLNVVVSPVDGMAPATPHNLVNKKNPEVFSHAAASIASIAGFWHGQTQTPISAARKGRVIGPGQNTVVSRSFVRYVDASDLVGDLVSSVARRDAGLIPNGIDERGNPFDAYESGQALPVVADIANEFFSANRAQLEYKEPPVFGNGPLKVIGFVDAIKLYFSFVFKWLWAAPGEWAREKISNAKAAIAASGQKFLGSESQYEVIVSGVSARSSESLKNINLSQEILDAARAGLGPANIPAPAAPFQLWQSMVSVTCNLADGGNTFDGLKLPAITGGDRVIIREPEMLTPNSNEKFFDVPAALPIPISGYRLSADDPYAAYVLMDQIDQALRDSASIAAVKYSELQQLKLEVEKWVKSNNSFVWLVGQKLALQLHRARIQSRQMLTISQNMGDGFELAEAEKAARRALWNVIKGGLYIIGLAGLAWGIQALVISIVTGKWPVMATDWYIPAFVAVALFILWNIVGMIMFHGKVGDFFNLEKRINEEKARARWAKENLQIVLRELHRLASLYGQYRLWVKAISPVFYRSKQKPEKQSLAKNTIKNLVDLPKSVVVAELAPTDEAREELFNRIRNSFYKRGWLQETLDKYIALRGLNLGEIWQDNAQSQNSELIKLAAYSGADDSESLLDNIAGASAKTLATSGTNYHHWTVRTKDKQFGQDLEGDRFTDALRRGAGAIPIGSILTAKGSVQGISAVSPQHSYFAHDERLSNDSDVSNLESLQSSELEERSLDFMVIRLEVSDYTSTDMFAFTEGKSEVEQETPSSKPTIEG